MNPLTTVEDLQTEISRTLRDLATECDLVTASIDTRRRGLGFLTYEARQAMDAALIAERADAAERLKKGEPVGWGATDPPGNIGAYSVAADVWRIVHAQIRRLVAHRHDVHGICTMHRLPPQADLEQLLGHLRRLVFDVDDVPTLTGVRAALAEASEAATTLLEGDARTILTDPCPHCDLPSLVVFFRDDLIRCDRISGSQHYHPCVCNDPLCECKQRPIEHRHTWHREKPASKSNSWRALANRLNTTRHAAEKAQKKAGPAT